MQTLTLQVQDSFVPNLLNFLEQFKNEVVIQKDKNLEYDPYFYERQKKLHKIREDIKNGKIQMIENDTFWADIDSYTKTL